jgi:chromosomal replication initiator protein
VASSPRTEQSNEWFKTGMESIWTQVKGELKTQLPENIFRMWIEPLDPAQGPEQEILLQCPNLFFLNWIKEKYLTLISETMGQLHLQPPRLTLQAVNSRTFAAEVPRTHQYVLPGLDHNKGRFQGGFTFDQFVTGSSNRFAYLATLALATEQNIYNNALYLYSSNGLGKTHLSQAVGRHLQQHKPSARVLYLSAEEFTQEMVISLKANRMETFKDKYRKNCDFLLLEEVHFLSGKETTQAELGYTLETLLNDNKKIIFTSSFLPKDLSRIGGKLKSQLSAAMLGGIEPPDFETRLGIVEKKAGLYGLDLEPRVKEYLADQPIMDIRQLESCLTSMKAQTMLLNQPVDLQLAEALVQQQVRTQREITIQDIKLLVGRYFKISTEEIVSKSRRRTHLYPRNLSIYLSKRFTNQTCETIGRAFNRDYSSIIHAVNAVEKSLKKNPEVSRQLNYLTEELEAWRRGGVS